MILAILPAILLLMLPDLTSMLEICMLAYEIVMICILLLIWKLIKKLPNCSTLSTLEIKKMVHDVKRKSDHALHIFIHVVVANLVSVAWVINTCLIYLLHYINSSAIKTKEVSC